MLRNYHIFSVEFSSVAQSCPTLCDHMICSMPGLLSITNSQSLLKLMSIESVMPSNHLILYHPLLLLPSLPASGTFPVSQLFSWGGQSTGVSASVSALPKNTQDWSPLGGTGWISLKSKGLSRVFSNTTVQLSHPYLTTGKTISLTRQTFVGRVISLLFNMLSRLV